MGRDLEWIEVDTAQNADGADHLDFGPSRPPPAWLSRRISWPARLPRLPPFGWVALVAIALIGGLSLGPPVAGRQPADGIPAHGIRISPCLVVTLPNAATAQKYDLEPVSNVIYRRLGTCLSHGSS